MIPILLWALLALLSLRLTERWVHRRLQRLGFHLTKNRDAALTIFAIILFPGVLLHELSHWLFARLLGVRTGRINLLPAVNKKGELQLGALEYYAAGLDPIRESLVGAAPLITGSIVLLLIANYLFGLPEAQETLSSGQVQAFLGLIWQSLHTPDFWLWLYLAFAVANAMMPSPADRRAWPAFAIIVALAVTALLLLGLGDWILISLEGPAALWLSHWATALTLSAGINLLIVLGMLTVEMLLNAQAG